MNRPTNVKEESIYYCPFEDELYQSFSWQREPCRDGWIIKLFRLEGSWFSVDNETLHLQLGHKTFVAAYNEKSKIPMVYIDTL